MGGGVLFLDDYLFFWGYRLTFNEIGNRISSYQLFKCVSVTEIADMGGSTGR